MVTKDDVKSYLNIPYDTEDTLIETAITGGYNYLANAIDDFSTLQESDATFAAQADLWVLTQWMPTMYDEREGMHSEHAGLNYAARAMLTQLQMYVATTTE